MKVTIEGTPEEIKKLFDTDLNSIEQKQIGRLHLTMNGKKY